MIFVFKTSVKNKRQVEQLQSQLRNNLLHCKWNFDLDDCDKILRVESDEDIVVQITNLLSDNGFQCAELT